MKQMKQMKHSDYCIIKLRTSASEYHMKKWLKEDNKNSAKINWEYTKVCVNFFYDLVKQVTSHEFDTYHQKYMVGASDCAREELESDFNILIRKSGSYDYYLIPKTNSDLIEWFKKTATEKKLTFKVVSKTSSMYYERRPSTWNRERSKEIVEKYIPNLNKD